MNSPVPGLWAGHYFSTWDSGVVGGNALTGNLIGAPTSLRGTDPSGYAQLVLGQYGVLAQPAGFVPSLTPSPSTWAKVAAFAIGLVLVILGVWFVASGEIGKAAAAGVAHGG